MVAMPPMKMLFLVSSLSLWECHMKDNPPIGILLNMRAVEGLPELPGREFRRTSARTA